MTDQDVVERFAALLAVGNIYFRKRSVENPHYKEQWQFVVGAYYAISDFFELVRPWLGQRRTARFLEVLEETAPRGSWQSRKTHCPQGHEYTPENTYLHKTKDKQKSHGGRSCKTCNRERQREYMRRKREGASA